MAREFHEEAGAIIKDWRLFCTTTARDGTVFFFTTNANIKIKQMEAEELVWVPHKRLFNYEVVDDLRWLIPMALAERHVCATVTEIT